MKQALHLALAGIVVALAASPAHAIGVPPSRDVSKLPAGVGVVEKLGDHVPLDLVFRDETGKQVKLGDYLADGKPVLLTLVYYKCTMLCSLTLNGMVGALRQQSWKLGKEFRVITLSFDPSEQTSVALEKQRGYLNALGLMPEEHGRDWPFLTGDKQNIAALADAVGFQFRWDDVNKTWDHVAALIALSPDGKVTRYLYGVQYPPRDVQLALFESANGKVGTTLDRALLRCYSYDGSTKSYRLFAVRFVRAGSLLVLGLLVTFLTMMWRRDLRRSRAGAHR